MDELNLYFRYIDQAFVQHGGVIDKRMGDGVMGVFVPRADRTVAEARRDAVRRALDLLRALDACNAELQRRGSRSGWPPGSASPLASSSRGPWAATAARSTPSSATS